ncbi:putative sucrose-phosphate synthase 5 [Acorus calamus]|uniref:Sucrose-phosphate synthase 5 n=1 Tax=Acorus calamus TaxID=4465 RepID=A0AAV9FHD9_ACOCL|nr:putative sucrose-phosphate synthase 5 [Acorus calamus]
MDGSDLNSDISTVVFNAIKHHPGDVDRPFRVSDGGPITNHPGRRRRIFVIAVDCYKSDGQIDVDHLSTIVDLIVKAGGSDGRTGLLFSTGSTVREAIEALESCHVSPQYFDALICGSGSDVCYPWRDLDADVEYAAHVEYKWPGEHVRATAMRLASASGDDVAADEDASEEGRRCETAAEDARIPMWRRLRPSRHPPERDTVVRFESSSSKVPLYKVGGRPIEGGGFCRRSGDTDHEELLLGLHKTVILEGSAEGGSERLVGGEEAYKREDVVPLENPNVVTVKEGYGPQDILAALETVGMH